MVSSVAQSGFAIPSADTALNSRQSESLLALLSNYNPKNLTQSDAQDIVSGIREIGIKNAKGLGAMLNQTGFQPRELAQKSGVIKADTNRPASSQSQPAHDVTVQDPQSRSRPENVLSNDALSALTRLVEKYEGHDLSGDDWANLYQELETEGLDVSKPLLDILM